MVQWARSWLSEFSVAVSPKRKNYISKQKIYLFMNGAQLSKWASQVASRSLTFSVTQLGRKCMHRVCIASESEWRYNQALTTLSLGLFQFHLHVPTCSCCWGHWWVPQSMSFCGYLHSSVYPIKFSPFIPPAVDHNLCCRVGCFIS